LTVVGARIENDRIFNGTILPQEGGSSLNECILANTRFITPVSYPYQAVVPGTPKALPAVCRKYN
jgi:hypothetical protein